MCTGLEIAALAGTALSAAGTAASTVGAQKQQKAAIEANNRVVQQFMDKNEKLAKESRGLFDDRLAQEGQTPQEEAAPKADARMDLSNDLIDTTRVVAPLRGSAPSVVKEAAQSETDRVDQTGRQRAQALADVQALGDMLFGKKLATHDAARDIGMVGGFAGSNADMVPTQAQLAQLSVAGKGSGLQTLGGGMSALGSLATMYGGSGADSLGIFGSSAAPKTAPMPRPRPNFRM